MSDLPGVLSNYRKTASTLFLAVTVALGGGADSAIAGDDEFVTGSGKADARVVLVGPKAARLGLTPSLALSLADFQGTRARGEARSVECAALESSVCHPEPDCGEEEGDSLRANYPHVKVENSQQNSEAGKTESHNGFTQSARAGDDPRGESRVDISAVQVPGVFTMSGGRSEAASGLVLRGGKLVRESKGEVHIKRVEFGDGAAVLSDLHWEVVQRTDRNDDPDPEVAGSFSVGRIKTADGVQRGDAGGIAAISGPVNEALAGLGIGVRFEPPRLVNRNGAAFITPLGIHLVDNKVGQPVGGIIGDDPVHSIRSQVVDFMVGEPEDPSQVDENGCPVEAQCEDCKTMVLIGDLSIGVVTGAGGAVIDLGGAAAYTEGRVFDSPFFDFSLPPLGDFNTPADSTDGGSPSPSQPGSEVAGETVTQTGGGSGGSSAGTTATGTIPGGGVGQQAIGSVEDAIGSSLSSAAGALGLLGFGAVSALALSEYRRMRARTRGIPV